ncbi:MAG: CoA transferase [Eubacterium sp.]|nr:CoA transferase [Candidatus Colimonas fimequi]
MTEQMMPLQGVKVVEMATVVAAPTTARMLCAYGAEVIKVETLDGDVMRLAGTHEMTPYEDDLNPLFTIHNSNKKFVSLNFKNEDGKKVLLDLIKDADVFITNVREKSLVRNGLDYETLKEVNPGLIYAHLKGYGDKGPSANDPGFDITSFWLRSGPIADWQTEGSFPFLPTYAFGDMVTSSTFLSGILMALYARQQTGKGTKVNTSLFASGIWCNAIGVVQTQFERKNLNPHPLRPSDPFNQTYLCKDGRWIGAYCNEYEMDREKWYGLLGIPEFATDPDYASIEVMQKTGSIETVIKKCNEIFLTKTAEEWREYFSENNCACEIMKASHEVSSDPQAIENGYMVPVEYPDADRTTVMMPAPPISFSDYAKREYKPTGVLGEDTDEILRGLGYSDEQIAEMRAAGAIK